MNLDREFGIDAKKAAAIADFFRDADKSIPFDSEALAPFIAGRYQEQFGRLNFGLLEAVFRQENFNTHFLAIPREMISPGNPDIIVVDINQKLKGKHIDKPFAAVAYPSLEDLVNAAIALEIDYDPEKNLENLATAGVYAIRSGHSIVQQGDPRFN